ncbi:MAG: cysteine desulfurase [Bacteroidia bacterium]|nr:MAG: cysteine desulfurase [Bacteroidia bacterium]
MKHPMAAAAREGLHVNKIRADFPILARTVHGKTLAYLDNAATSQKPSSVISAIETFYTTMNSNIHRGVHSLSEEATGAYEKSRDLVRRFIGAESTREIIFVRGTTEAINLVASSFVQPSVKAGDEILITGLEHHSNIVPWQLVCGRTGAVLRVVPITDEGEVLLEEFASRLTPKTKFVAVAHVSNALGTVNPIQAMVTLARERGIPVLVDGAQAVPHLPVNVRELGADFYAFSGHKMYGPTGVGVLYGREELLSTMTPYQGGGDMIKSVSFEKTVYNDLPHRFEAGTPNIGGVIGLGEAIRYLSSLDWRAVEEHEADLVAYCTTMLSAMPGVRIIGTAREKAGVVSFVVEGIHPHDIGTILDQEGIAVRTGHHCAQPVMERFGIPATVRASFAVYNTREEVDRLGKGLRKVKEVFG